MTERTRGQREGRGGVATQSRCDNLPSSAPLDETALMGVRIRAPTRSAESDV